MQPAHHAADARLRERRRQRGGRPVLALVRLVEDRDVVGRQQRAAHRQIEEEQRVVDDDDVGEARRVASREEMAVGESARRIRRRSRRRRRRAVPNRARGGANGSSARSPVSVRSAHFQSFSIAPLGATSRSALIRSNFAGTDNGCGP